MAIHVDQNAEKVRDKFVAHDGKMKLELDIPREPTREQWMQIIKAFAEKMDANTVSDTCKLMECDFSTSTMAERLAAKVTIMDICKNYFDNRMYTMCGFPQITLDGTKDDWIKLREKVRKLLSTKVSPKFGENWKKSLLPLLDRFIAAYDGEINGLFWNSMIKRGATVGSGSITYYCGWINILFPFLDGKANQFNVPYSEDRDYVKQGLVAEYRHSDMYEKRERGGDIDDYPIGLASAPVTLDDVIKMKFLAGFVGYKQDEKTGEITPNVAW